MNLATRLQRARVLLTGAGSSAYAASSAALAWPGAVAIPTTDLLIDPERYLLGVVRLYPWPARATAPRARRW